jgi:hypothetical protein
MDVVRLRIPYQFVRERTRMSWRDVRFGLVNQLLDARAPVELAVAQVGERAEPSVALLELAGAVKGEAAFELVDHLANEEPTFRGRDPR